MGSKTLRVCPQGHRYYKTSDCPTCPQCEAGKKPATGFMSGLSAPALRALKAEGITTLKKLSKYSEREILALHGIGKTALPILNAELKKVGLGFRPTNPAETL